MPTETIEALVDGGAATAGPPLGPVLGPMGVNIMEIINAVNERTAKFKGMKVPVVITIDTGTKKYEIKVGTPPTSSLLKEKLGIAKGSGSAATNKVADLSIEQAKEIAEMKSDDLLGRTLKDKVKEVMGTCVSMGITVDGKDPRDAQKALDNGEYDSQF